MDATTMSPRVPRQQLSVRLGNPPLGVKILTPGSYRDAVDLYRAAESHARSVDSSVLSPDLLDRISSELTGRSGTTSVPRREARSPLSVSPSAAERTAVRNLRGLAAELAAESPTPQRPASTAVGVGYAWSRRRAGRRITHPPKASTADGVGHTLKLPDLGGPSMRSLAIQ